MRVCIIGDGLSGLTLAKALVNLNIYVDVLAKKKEFKFNQSRTLSISKTNIDFFNKNITNIDKLLWGLNKIEIYTDNLKNEKLLNFENNNNHLFSIIKNNQLYKILDKVLRKDKYFKKIFLNNENLSFINRYDLIINCDYFHPITKKYFSKKIEKKYNSFAYTTIIHHEKILNNVATQIFTKRGPLAFLPISNDETSVVYSLHNSNNTKKENIEELIKIYNFKYKIKKVEKIYSFKLNSLKHKNLIYSSGIDLLHEFFNIERKFNNKILSKTIQTVGKNSSLNKVFTKIADRGVLF